MVNYRLPKKDIGGTELGVGLVQEPEDRQRRVDPPACVEGGAGLRVLCMNTCACTREAVGKVCLQQGCWGGRGVWPPFSQGLSKVQMTAGPQEYTGQL